MGDAMMTSPIAPSLTMRTRINFLYSVLHTGLSEVRQLPPKQQSALSAQLMYGRNHLTFAMADCSMVRIGSSIKRLGQSVSFQISRFSLRLSFLPSKTRQAVHMPTTSRIPARFLRGSTTQSWAMTAFPVLRPDPRL